MASVYRKRILGTFGALLGLIYNRGSSPSDVSQRLRDYVMIVSSFRFRLVHSSLFGFLIVANFFKWLFFGKLTPYEIATVREKAGYTAWEFIFGFVVFYSSTGSFLDIYTELFKFAGLFLCVWLVKVFHYLTAGRVQFANTGHEDYDHTNEERNMNHINNDQGTQTSIIGHGGAAGGIHAPFLILRLGLGILCLNFVDGLLIYRYWYDIIFQNYLKHNVLIAIFGFEIMNHFPMILSTSLQFGLNTYEILAVSPRSCEWKEWKLRKIRATLMAEFVFNLIRLAMSLVFSLLFLYYYTVPVHMLPAAYNSLKIAVLKTRIYVDFRKREFSLQKLRKSGVSLAETCIICYDELTTWQDIRVVPGCGHTFHFECIQLWLDYLVSCPICREKI